MLSQLLMIFIMIAFDGCFLEGAVHAFDLTIGPGVIWLGQAMFRTIFQADTVEDMQESMPVCFAVGELDAVVCEDGMDFIGHGGDEIAQELRCFHLAVLGQ